MENREGCHIQGHLGRIRSSMRSASEFYEFTELLSKTLNEVVNSSVDLHLEVVKIDCLVKSPMFERDEVQDFLQFLGFSEMENERSYKLTDESIMVVESAITIIEKHFMKNKALTLEEILDVQDQDESVDDIKTKKTMSSPSLNRKKSKSSCSSANIKKSFLSKHFEKESSESPSVFSRFEQKSKIKANDYTFKANGYFQQLCNRAETKRKDCFMKEVFHHESKAWGSCSSSIKLF